MTLRINDRLAERREPSGLQDPGSPPEPVGLTTQVLAAVERLRRRAVAARNVLVFEDGTGLGRELALELRAAGHAVDIVRPGDGFGRDPDGAFRLRPDSREDHGALLREVGADGRTPSQIVHLWGVNEDCLLYTSPSPRDRTRSRMPSSA